MRARPPALFLRDECNIEPGEGFGEPLRETASFPARQVGVVILDHRDAVMAVRGVAGYQRVIPFAGEGEVS